MYAMFSQFGKILDVVCLKTFRLRGQAWIVFSDVAAATNALRTMQGFPFFDKPIVSTAASSLIIAHIQMPSYLTMYTLVLLIQRVTYAKTKSDAVAKLDGSYKPDKKKRSERNAQARGARCTALHCASWLRMQLWFWGCAWGSPCIDRHVLANHFRCCIIPYQQHGGRVHALACPMACLMQSTAPTWLPERQHQHGQMRCFASW